MPKVSTTLDQPPFVSISTTVSTTLFASVIVSNLVSVIGSAMQVPFVMVYNSMMFVYEAATTWDGNIYALSFSSSLITSRMSPMFNDATSAWGLADRRASPESLWRSTLYSRSKWSNSSWSNRPVSWSRDSVSSEDDDRTNRFVLQRLGDVCKTAFDEEGVFSLRVVRYIQARVTAALADGTEELRFLITDNRFPAELAAIRRAVESMEGVTSSVVHRWLITSVDDRSAPSLKDTATASHSSEVLMKEMQADATLVNNMTGLGDLWSKVQVALNITVGMPTSDSLA